MSDTMTQNSDRTTYRWTAMHHRSACKAKHTLVMQYL